MAALAMPMGDPQQRTRDRLSTRMSIQHILQRSEMSFISALNLASGSGKVEDVRQSCLSLALLRTFQTSLGEGSLDVTASAADILGKCIPYGVCLAYKQRLHRLSLFSENCWKPSSTSFQCPATMTPIGLRRHSLQHRQRIVASLLLHRDAWHRILRLDRPLPLTLW